MTLTINGEQYKAVSIPDPHPEIAKKAWRLTHGRDVYDVYLDAVDNQVKCDCKDFIARREWRYEIKPKKGRLYVSLQHGKKGNGGGPEALVLTLTARGAIEEQGVGLDAGLDLGHGSILKGFARFTSPAAKAYWRLSDADLRA